MRFEYAPNMRANLCIETLWHCVFTHMNLDVCTYWKYIYA